MGMRVGARAVRWILRMIVTSVGDRADIVPVIMRRHTMHLLVGQRVRVGKLRGMQDRHLATAKHGDGEQRGDHDVLDDPVHALNKPGCSCFVKRTAVPVKKLAAVIF